MTGGAPPGERSSRAHDPHDPRHRRAHDGNHFAGTFAALGSLAFEGASVSACIIDVRTGRAVLSIDDRIVLPTASVGTILLLLEVSARLTARNPSAHGIVDREPLAPVGDAGLWRHLQVPALPVADLAALVGAASDNLATNALLDRIGLDAVRERAEAVGLTRTALLDLVRDNRGPDDAPQLSVGSTGELAGLMAGLTRGEVVDSATSRRVLGWLALNADLSLVASAFGLDPLAHHLTDHDLRLVNKTGTDAGVRADVGVLRGPRASVAYAVAVQFVDDNLNARLRVLDTFRAVGFDILDYVH